VKGETLQVDAPEKGISESEGKAAFQMASSDDSQVFFTDTQQLTADSTAAPEVPGASLPRRADLYECEVKEEAGKLACNLKDLTADHNPGESAAVRGQVLGASEDGSYVYLVANGVLTNSENARHETAARGNCGVSGVPPASATCNLYLLRREGE